MEHAKEMASACVTMATPASIARIAMSNTTNPFAMQQSFCAHLVILLVGTAAVTELAPRAVASARTAGTWTPRAAVWTLTSAWTNIVHVSRNNSALTMKAHSPALNAIVLVTDVMEMDRICVRNAQMAINLRTANVRVSS